MAGSVSAGAFGQSAPTPPNLSTYQPQYTSQADQSAFSNINQIQNNNPFLQNQGQYQSIEQQGLNNTYASGVQTAANTAGQQYGQLGQQGMAASTALNQGAMSLLPYVSQVENTAMDPQNALYNQTLQQVQNQANVSNAQNGLTNSPFGAGVANQANNQFNMNWQNQQLGRQEGGISAAATGLGAAGNAMGQAQTVGQNAATNTVASGAIPNVAYLGNLNNQSTALNNYGQAMMNANANTQTAQQDFMQYLSGGEAQSTAQANLNQTNYQNQTAYVNAQNQGMANAIDGGLSLVGAMGGYTGSTNPASGTGTGTGSTAAGNGSQTGIQAQAAGLKQIGSLLSQGGSGLSQAFSLLFM